MAGHIRRDDLRASEVIKRLRALLARHQTEHRRFDLHRLVEETLVLLRAVARRREIELELRVEAQRDTVLGDPVQLQQVLLNLELNAFDASAALPPGERRVIVRTTRTSRGIELGVRDFGSGIAATDRARVFDPGFTTKSRGWGLGLALGKRIVEEMHGGTIRVVQTQPGKGTTFLVTWHPPR